MLVRELIRDLATADLMNAEIFLSSDAEGNSIGALRGWSQEKSGDIPNRKPGKNTKSKCIILWPSD